MLTAVTASGTLPAIDVDRMRRQRLEKLRAEVRGREVDAAVLLHGPHITYATGHVPPAVDVTHASFRRPLAIVGGDGPDVRLHAHEPTDPALLCDVGAARRPELDDDMAALRASVMEVIGNPAGKRIAVDALTGAMVRAGLLDGAELVDASRVLGAARICKTDDELACIETAQIINEQAMESVRIACVPGITRARSAGLFLAELRARGAMHNEIDPIFQPMPRCRDDGCRTFNGHVAFPTGIDNPTFETGDLVWVDSGHGWEGYASDYGRSWIVGRDPSDAEQRLFERWLEVMDASYGAIWAGATLGDVGRAAIAANDGEMPWLPHFYLAHGVGLESAEMPMIGCDLGQEFDDGFVLAPGMVLVLEPVIWEDGVGGYRAEEIVAVTDEGYRRLGGSIGYDPFRT